MPIEFGFIPSGEFEEYKHRLVEPGEVVFIADYSEGEERILGVGCKEDDTGGYVKIFKGDEIVTIDDTEEQPYIEDLPEPIGSIEVAEERPHEQEWSDGEMLGTFKAKYVPSDEISPGGHIPNGLINPN
jgi:hypothetical protein